MKFEVRDYDDSKKSDHLGTVEIDLASILISERQTWKGELKDGSHSGGQIYVQFEPEGSDKSVISL